MRGLGKLCQPGFQAKLCQTNITLELKPNLHVFGSINFDSCLLWHQVKHITWFLLCLWPSQIYHMIVWHVCLICNSQNIDHIGWDLFQYPIRRLIIRSRRVLKLRDLYLDSHDCSEIWQALRPQCCRCACQISKRCNNWTTILAGSRLREILWQDVLSGTETGCRSIYLTVAWFISYQCLFLCDRIGITGSNGKYNQTHGVQLPSDVKMVIIT